MADTSYPAGAAFPATLDVDYPDRELNRVTTAFRVFTVIPIGIILLLVSGAAGGGGDSHGNAHGAVCTAGGVLFGATACMILFRQKYPRWWFDWNLALVRFQTRVAAYVALLRDEYPSTDAPQAVHLDLRYPDVARELNRWMPLVKWFLAIPHYLVLALLSIAGCICILVAWFVILFTGRYPRPYFDFIVGIMRWWLRVMAYAFLLVTDRYPPFSLRA